VVERTGKDIRHTFKVRWEYSARLSNLQELDLLDLPRRVIRLHSWRVSMYPPSL
jgi:hypothetical protein